MKQDVEKTSICTCSNCIKTPPTYLFPPPGREGGTGPSVYDDEGDDHGDDDDDQDDDDES